MKQFRRFFTHQSFKSKF